MKYNTDKTFVGLEKLINKQLDQLYDFENWAAGGEWIEFHRNHYDWWMFPYDKPSRLGKSYTIYEGEVAELKRDSCFMQHYLRGIELLLLSWGWKLHERRMVDKPEPFQEWAEWPIRLYKCAVSLQLFGLQEEFESVRMYALRLIKENKNFWYDGKDCSELFSLKILYIHGLSSSGKSSTAQRIRTLLPQAIVYSPDLPIEPDEAVALLHNIADKKHIDIAIGTSMGGMFAQKLRGYPKIMVNPSFHVFRTMRKRIGMNPFFSERENGEKEYEITEELCKQYEVLEREQFNNLTEKERQLSVGLFGTQDNTVNCIEEYRQHYRIFKTFKGGHRLTEENIRQVILPLIKELIPEYLWQTESFI